ncbi:hypothetical protein IW140_005718 [Coemansia sp. RSA 1813]|nr:hypothetical protein EV178_005733 [Coemansia sp. RSA 1646]KAJ1768192.1 hypothetical protein LPJ74_004969 [Coemansia sp. RSA 1843]KAJ2086442.1 hypothetical protein IW138_005687 [Coemansia sp. RSA 986]KAJ2211106.1 hypothetical protein EV179_005753 [Coemansia sp. RSA 487]KAJ2564536.1 hypothetical protein IW140_005718 [Coemansia sp. RSA 1813]
MVQLNYDSIIQCAFPALLLALFVYAVKDWVANRLASYRRSEIDLREMARSRVLSLQKKTEAAEKELSIQKKKQSPDTAEFSVKPKVPKSTSVPFGSQNMTMADLRSRINRGSSSTCSYGSCCG